MEKRVEPLEIKTTTDGAIDLIQGDGYHDDDASVIRIPVDQVDFVIRWLKEAKAELEGPKTGTLRKRPAPRNPKT